MINHMSFRDKLKQVIQDKDANDFELDRQERQMPGDELETFTPSPFFGVEAVRNAPVALELRLVNGRSCAFPYSYVMEVNYDPTDGIEIICTARKIVVIGRNLKQLYIMLVAFRVKWIQANQGNDLTEDGKLFVKEIRVAEV